MYLSLSGIFPNWTQEMLILRLITCWQRKNIKHAKYFPMRDHMKRDHYLLYTTLHTHVGLYLQYGIT